MVQVGKARKKYNVQPPAMYAPDGHEDGPKFNAIQRVHQNFLETWASFDLMMVVVGLSQPTVAWVCGVIWMIGRLIFWYGYTQAPEKRKIGFMIVKLSELPLWIMLIW